MGFVTGLLLGIGVMALAWFLNGKKITVRWYEWLLGTIGLIFLLWAINDYFASVAEHNEYAGMMLLWMLSIPAVIFLGLGIFLSWWRLRPREAQRLATTPDKKPRFKPTEADLAR